jgi:hypothetical protein
VKRSSTHGGVRKGVSRPWRVSRRKPQAEKGSGAEMRVGDGQIDEEALAPRRRAREINGAGFRRCQPNYPLGQSSLTQHFCGSADEVN